MTSDPNQPSGHSGTVNDDEFEVETEFTNPESGLTKKPKNDAGSSPYDDSEHRKLVDEEIRTRRRHARYSALWFMSISGGVIVLLLVLLFILLFKMLSIYGSHAFMLAEGGQNSWSLGLPALPIFSLTLMILLMFITLSRFIKHFVSERNDRDSEIEDANSDGVILAALEKLNSLFTGSKK